MRADLPATLQRLLGDTYRLESELLGAGMSRVFVAEQPALRRRVVVKVLPPDLVSAASLTRFQHEIEVTARLQHPHILPIVTAGSAEGISWYIAPYIEERSLRDRLERVGRVPRDEALRFLSEVSEAVAFAHARGVVHRDIKPGNVLLNEGHAVLADFGVASALFGDDPAGGITGIETHAALAAYLPPDAPGGEGADLWALGALGHELLTGEVPELPVSTRSVLAKLGASGPLERAIADLLAKALAETASARFANAEEFRAALQHLRNAATGGGAARRWRAAALAVGAVAVLIAGINIVRAGVRHQVAGERPIAVVVEDEGSSGDALREALEGALREWREVAVAAADEERGTQRLLIRRNATGGVDARLLGSNGRPIVIVENVMPVSHAGFEDAALRDVAREVASVILREAPSPLAPGAPTASLSLEAWRAHDTALALLEQVRLDDAQAELRRALRADPAHRASRLRLAVLLLAVADSSGRAEAELLLRGLGPASSNNFAESDALRASGWRAIIDREFGTSCDAFNALVDREPESWDAWLGLGYCRAYDDVIIRTSSSPTGLAFRSGYHGAAFALERADALTASRAPRAVYAGLHRVLPRWMNNVRYGRVDGTTETMIGHAELRDDTLAHIPGRPGGGRSTATTRAAIESARQRKHAIAVRRFAAAPDDRQASIYLAEVLEYQGVIDRPRAEGLAALPLVRARRQHGREVMLEDAWAEARLLLKAGQLAAAIETAQSTLRLLTPRTTADEAHITLFATLTGDSARLRTALHRAAAHESRQLAHAGRTLRFPEPVLIAQSRLLAPGFLGHCNEDVRLGWQRLMRAIDLHVGDPGERETARVVMTWEAAALGSTCVEMGDPTDDWRDLPRDTRLAVHRGDAEEMHAIARSLVEQLPFHLPGEISWESLHTVVQGLHSVGDVEGAYDVAARQLGGIANTPIDMFARLEELAGMRRLLVLARELAPTVPGVDRGDWWLSPAPGLAPVVWAR